MFEFAYRCRRLVVALLVSVPCWGIAAKQPNIVFILTDDQGYGDVQRHGHPYLQTPNLNKLYDESVRLDNFYVSPSCSPTRAALLTGMHEFRSGVTHTLVPREHLHIDATTFPELLQSAGYFTGFIGKWHLGHGKGYEPHFRGFDWCSTNRMGPRKHFDVEIIRNHESRQTKGYREDVYFDEAMAFIEDSGERPFFLYLSTYSPHTPLAAPDSYIKPFRDAGLNDTHATYLAMIENIDTNVGRLMDYLDAEGLAEDTIIIYMNDNGVTEGLDVYNAEMRGCKATAWEGGSRAMSFWSWPGKWAPYTATNLSAHLDVLPTLCELAGAEIPAELEPELQGFSLLPVLEAGEPVSWNDKRMLFHHVGRWPSGLAESHKYAMVSVRRGDYLLVRSNACGDPACEEFMSQCSTMRAVENGLTTTTYAYGTAQQHWGTVPMGTWALYDVKADPACSKDLSGSMPELAASLAASYDVWWDEQYPVMIARGGDAGDPWESAKASKKARAWKGPKTEKEAAKQSNAGREQSHFERMDADADGKLTQEEYVAYFIGAFDNRDTDQDTRLSAAEFGHAAFERADTDRDGYLSFDEYEAFYERQFQRMDQDDDGVLLPADL